MYFSFACIQTLYKWNHIYSLYVWLLSIVRVITIWSSCSFCYCIAYHYRNILRFVHFLLVDFWDISSLGILWVMLLWTFLYMSLGVHVP